MNRAQFWQMRLFIIVTTGILGLIVFEISKSGIDGPIRYVLVVFGVLSLFLGLIFWFWSGLAVDAKRWHDRNKSAWWILIEFIPLIGAIWSFIELGFLKGTDSPNRFGPDH